MVKIFDPFLGPWKNLSDAQTGSVILATSHGLETRSFDGQSSYRSNPGRGLGFRVEGFRV